MERFSTSLLGEAKTLLIATDGSQFSEGAIQEAIFFGQACQAKVIVLHVVIVQAESISAANFLVRQGREEIAPHLDHIRAMAKDGGVELEIVVVGSSRLETTIVEQARLRGADVILMGRRGKTAAVVHAWQGSLDVPNSTRYQPGPSLPKATGFEAEGVPCARVPRTTVPG